MAWADVGAGFGPNNENTSSSSFSLFGSSNPAVGDVLVVICATDNITTTDTNSNDHTGVATAGGTGVLTAAWTKIYEFTNGNAAGNAGATVSAWFNIATATTVGATTLSLSGSVAAKAYVGRRFTVGAGSTVQHAAGSPATLATDASDPVSLTLSGLASKEYLFVRAIANETNADTAVTNSAGWTALGGGVLGSSTGGGAAANMAIGGEFKIATGTSSGASDPTWTSGDNANILFALEEVVTATPMPIVNFATQIA